MTPFVFTVIAVAAILLVLILASLWRFLIYCDEQHERDMHRENEKRRAQSLFQDQTFD